MYTILKRLTPLYSQIVKKWTHIFLMIDTGSQTKMLIGSLAVYTFYYRYLLSLSDYHLYFTWVLSLELD